MAPKFMRNPIKYLATGNQGIAKVVLPSSNVLSSWLFSKSLKNSRLDLSKIFDQTFYLFEEGIIVRDISTLISSDQNLLIGSNPHKNKPLFV